MNISKTGYQFIRSQDGNIHTVKIFEEKDDGMLHYLTQFAQNRPFTGGQIFARLEEFETK